MCIRDRYQRRVHGRDGFCLLPFEFMLTKDINDSAPGAIILSEFVVCVSAMSSICHINPYNIPEIVNSIVNVIESNQGNFKDTKFKHDLGYILENNTEKWVKSLIIELKKASIKNESALFLGAIEKKLMKDNKTFNPLTTKILETPYCSAVNRLILLDSEGTILPYVHQALIKSTEIVKPSLLQLLEKLCKDERNSVYILSGKPKEVINKWFGKVPNLGLAAEYGFYEKYPHTTEWKKNSVFKDNSWKEQTLEIFKWYKEKTDGASIEVKDCSLVWRYKEADPEFGLWQAKDMQKSLKIALAQFPSIKTILGKGFVEVKPRALEKGELVERIIHREEENMGKFDFIFCIGDDVVDEEMFTKINTVFGKPSSPRHTVERACNYFTCTVGKKPSNAQYYVNDYQDTTTILSNMSSWSMKIKKNKSQEHIDFSEIRRSPADIYTPPFVYSSSPKDHPETLDISKP
eukprot:TRINITY_DN3835_c0_g1_i1.p1 TRINITY_DN3835_c0_g1~~TRINITY_DN3835_c0_g1_i1.p1  ORF type:complete len:462 (-),score=75.37 TRINITY_DN3835_c0_g1_i1:206-1591(-)